MTEMHRLLQRQLKNLVLLLMDYHKIWRVGLNLLHISIKHTTKTIKTDIY